MFPGPLPFTNVEELEEFAEFRRYKRNFKNASELQQLQNSLIASQATSSIFPNFQPRPIMPKIVPNGISMQFERPNFAESNFFDSMRQFKNVRGNLNPYLSSINPNQLTMTSQTMSRPSLTNSSLSSPLSLSNQSILSSSMQNFDGLVSNMNFQIPSSSSISTLLPQTSTMQLQMPVPQVSPLAMPMLQSSTIQLQMPKTSSTNIPIPQESPILPSTSLPKIQTPKRIPQDLIQLPIPLSKSPTKIQTQKSPELPKPFPKRPVSPIIDVEIIEENSEIKKPRLETIDENEELIKREFTTKTTNFLPNFNASSPTKSICNHSCEHDNNPDNDNDKDGEPTETHIIITARPTIYSSITTENDDVYQSTDSESDYDTSVRPKETPLQYKDRMLERAMKKNQASKKSREKRKREHEYRQNERRKLEQRNIQLSQKLLELKEALNNLRPQICDSCNDQVQTFLDQCQNNKTGMNVFVLKPCQKADCRGNKNFKIESIKKTIL